MTLAGCSSATDINAYPVTQQTEQSFESLTSRQVVMQCTTDMATQFHIHAHLVMMIDKQNVPVPAEIGIDDATQCMHSIHTHDDTGVIHIEAPVQKDFTLADFFYIWGKSFNKDQIMDSKVDATHGLKMYVDGKEVQSFENLVLQDTQDIFIDYYLLKDGPDAVPAFYPWEGGKTNTTAKPMA